jgi:hypothetical protein
MKKYEDVGKKKHSTNDNGPQHDDVFKLNIEEKRKGDRSVLSRHLL